MTTYLKNISGSSITLVLGNELIITLKPNELISSINYTWEDYMVQTLINNNVLTKLIVSTTIIGIAPTIITQPVAPAYIDRFDGRPRYIVGDSLSFSVVATGDPVLIYAWEYSVGYLDPLNIPTNSWSSVGSSTTTLDTIISSSELAIRVTVSNGFGTITSNVITMYAEGS